MSSDINYLKSHHNALALYIRHVPEAKKTAKGYHAHCPFPGHHDSTASFDINLKNGQWLHNCLGCNRGGTIIDFYMHLFGLSVKEAISRVERELGTNSKVDKVFSPVVTPKKYGTYTLEQFKKYEDAFWSSKEAQEAVLKRGITLETAKKFHIGLRWDVGSMAGDDNADIASKGWLAFPYIKDGKVGLVKYRSIVRKAFCRQSGMETLLFNADTIDPFEPVYLVEGEWDCMTLEQAGFHSVSLCSAGQPPTPQQRELLKGANYIVLAGDVDPVGSGVMGRLLADFGEDTYYLTWRDGCKDANEAYLKDSKNFADTVRALAKLSPQPGVYSLPEAMLLANRTNLADHPDRLHLPWPSVDRMANLLKGSILSLFATQTGMGKTSWLMNVLVDAAKRGEVVLNYSAELTTDEYCNLVAAHVLRKGRNELTQYDYRQAAVEIGSVRFYVGRDPDLYSVDKVLDLIEAAVRRLGATVVAIDHIHFLVRNEHDTIKAQENAFKRIKNMAVKYGLKIIVVGQPRKASQQTRGKRVTVSDFKGSETFGSDSDVLIGLHRDTVEARDPQNPPREPFDPKTEVHLLKGRSQGTGGAYTELMFLGDIVTFVEIERREDEPY